MLHCFCRLVGLQRQPHRKSDRENVSVAASFSPARKSTGQDVAAKTTAWSRQTLGATQLLPNAEIICNTSNISGNDLGTATFVARLLHSLGTTFPRKEASNLHPSRCAVSSNSSLARRRVSKLSNLKMASSTAPSANNVTRRWDRSTTR